ncbi:hypothetical protein EDD86DRAFT_247541 [Gorgonomyces haynaldii]|nr:hypothetical protein EDD86DRAFT_247541 [Gorgonomyces haynaldii]
MSLTYPNRFNPYLYNASVFHGVGLQEAACCLYLLLSKGLSDRKVTKTPIFVLSSIAFIVICVEHGLIMFMGQFLQNPPPEDATDPGWIRYRYALQTMATILNTPKVCVHMVILLRIVAFNERKSPIFISVASLVAVFCCVFVVNAYLAVITTGQFHFFNAPTYKFWLFTTGICMALDAVINITAAIVFLKHIASVLKIPSAVLFRTIMVRHDGMRWLTLIGVNVYFVIAVIWGVAVSDVSTFGMFIGLYTFLESSYVAAKQILEENTMASADLQLETIKTRHMSPAAVRSMSISRIE